MLTKSYEMIDFNPILPNDKSTYEKYLLKEQGRGCEFSFANLYLWGRQKIGLINDHIVLFSQFDRKSVYPYPLGEGDKKAVIDAIIEDSKARGIPCRITGLSEKDKEIVESLYPDKFRFHCDEGGFDYVYDIDDLADLKGKKYHAKRNHIHRFVDSYPNYTVEPIDEKNICLARQMAEEWFKEKLDQNPNGDYHMERAALDKAFRYWRELELEGILILNGEDPLAMTMGSRLNSNTFDVQFEKARSDVQGAYPTVNREFARYIRENIPTYAFWTVRRIWDLRGLEELSRAIILIIW